MDRGVVRPSVDEDEFGVIVAAEIFIAGLYCCMRIIN
jgi:hypothetical protein